MGLDIGSYYEERKTVPSRENILEACADLGKKVIKTQVMPWINTESCKKSRKEQSIGEYSSESWKCSLMVKNSHKILMKLSFPYFSCDIKVYLWDFPGGRVGMTACTAGNMGFIPDEELRSHMPGCVAKK